MDFLSPDRNTSVAILYPDKDISFLSGSRVDLVGIDRDFGYRSRVFYRIGMEKEDMRRVTT
jgi:hypothetical protein